MKRLKWIIILLIACQSAYGQFYNYGRFILEEQDKQKHYAAGVVISTLGYQWGLRKWEDRNKAALFAIGLGLTAGIAKESFDNWRPPNYFDERDLLATVMGSVTVTIPLFCLQKPKKRYKH